MGLFQKSPLIHNTKVGDRIKIREIIEGNAELTEYEIIKVFPHIALGVNKKGFKRGIAYGDLVIAGIEDKERYLQEYEGGEKWSWL